MWRRRTPEPEPERDPFGSPVADECEAFLAGRLGAYLRETGRLVLPIAWLNRVVHAPPDELDRLALLGASGAPVPRWEGAVGYLARSLLARSAETGRPVAELQATLLVPLELRLVGDPDAAVLDAADMIRLALACLYELPELSL